MAEMPVHADAMQWLGDYGARLAHVPDGHLPMTIRDDMIEAVAQAIFDYAWELGDGEQPPRGGGCRLAAEIILAPFLPDDDGIPPWMVEDGRRKRWAEGGKIEDCVTYVMKTPAAPEVANHE